MGEAVMPVLARGGGYRKPCECEAKAGKATLQALLQYGGWLLERGLRQGDPVVERRVQGVGTADKRVGTGRYDPD